MSLLNIFVGVPQSKFAALALLVALLVVSVAMLVGKSSVPLGQRIVFVVLMALIALPSVLLSLFQLTCFVTGAGAKNQRWWCTAYAWIGTGLIVFYSAFVVIVGVYAMINPAPKPFPLPMIELFANRKGTDFDSVLANLRTNVVSKLSKGLKGKSDEGTSRIRDNNISNLQKFFDEMFATDDPKYDAIKSKIDFIDQEMNKNVGKSRNQRSDIDYNAVLNTISEIQTLRIQ